MVCDYRVQCGGCEDNGRIACIATNGFSVLLHLAAIIFIAYVTDATRNKKIDYLLVLKASAFCFLVKLIHESILISGADTVIPVMVLELFWQAGGTLLFMGLTEGFLKSVLSTPLRSFFLRLTIHFVLIAKALILSFVDAVSSSESVWFSACVVSIAFIILCQLAVDKRGRQMEALLEKVKRKENRRMARAFKNMHLQKKRKKSEIVLGVPSKPELLLGVTSSSRVPANTQRKPKRRQNNRRSALHATLTRGLKLAKERCNSPPDMRDIKSQADSFLMTHRDASQTTTGMGEGKLDMSSLRNQTPTIVTPSKKNGGKPVDWESKDLRGSKVSRGTKDSNDLKDSNESLRESVPLKEMKRCHSQNSSPQNVSKEIKNPKSSERKGLLLISPVESTQEASIKTVINPKEPQARSRKVDTRDVRSGLSGPSPRAPSPRALSPRALSGLRKQDNLVHESPHSAATSPSSRSNQSGMWASGSHSQTMPATSKKRLSKKTPDSVSLRSPYLVPTATNSPPQGSRDVSRDSMSRDSTSTADSQGSSKSARIGAFLDTVRKRNKFEAVVHRAEKLIATNDSLREVLVYSLVFIALVEALMGFLSLFNVELYSAGVLLFEIILVFLVGILSMVLLPLADE